MSFIRDLNTDTNTYCLSTTTTLNLLGGVSLKKLELPHRFIVETNDQTKDLSIETDTEKIVFKYDEVNKTYKIAYYEEK